MGRRGPARAPTALRVLHGETRPSRVNDAEPHPRDLPPEQPEWLSARARATWERIAPDLEAMGTVKRIDETVLAAFCEAAARMQVAYEAVAGTGLWVRDPDGSIRKNPAVAQARDATNDVRMLAREIGASPSARAGIRVHVTHEGLPAERLLT
jgi:P27 family predicted phage terminase small subunit